MEERVPYIEQRLREISRDFQVKMDHIIARIVNCEVNNELVDKQFEKKLDALKDIYYSFLSTKFL